MSLPGVSIDVGQRVISDDAQDKEGVQQHSLGGCEALLEITVNFAAGRSAYGGTATQLFQGMFFDCAEVRFLALRAH